MTNFWAPMKSLFNRQPPIYLLVNAQAAEALFQVQGPIARGIHLSKQGLHLPGNSRHSADQQVTLSDPVLVYCAISFCFCLKAISSSEFAVLRVCWIKTWVHRNLPGARTNGDPVPGDYPIYNPEIRAYTTWQRWIGQEYLTKWVSG